MKISRTLIIISVFQICLFNLAAQSIISKKWSLNGYLSNMQTILDIDSLNGYWLYQSQLHNRLNFELFPVSQLLISAGVRNRLIFGDMIRMDFSGQYARSLREESGWLDLSYNLLEKNSYILNTNIDRLFLRLQLNKLWITVGKQRINWGQTIVWNPNDWFNTYSFFDFDYEERPGSDAIRIQYFTGFTSSAEVAVKLDHEENVTAALLLKVNKWQYDIQLLAGVLSGNDYGIGAGWSGHIRNIGFRGELNYFHPIDNFKDTTGLFCASVGFDYIFDNSLTLQFEGLYNQQPEGYEQEDFVEYYQRSLSVKDLSITEWNLFGQISYPITPLLTGTLSGMIFPKLEGYFIGPNITYSLSDNLDLSLVMQAFSGEFPNQEGIDKRRTINLGFLRFKYNF